MADPRLSPAKDTGNNTNNTAIHDKMRFALSCLSSLMVLFLCVVASYSEDAPQLGFPLVDSTSAKQGIDAFILGKTEGVTVHVGRRSAKDRVNSIYVSYKSVPAGDLHREMRKSYAAYCITDAVVGENEMALQINGELVLLCVWNNGDPKDKKGVNLVILCEEYLIKDNNGNVKSVYAQAK